VEVLHPLGNPNQLRKKEPDLLVAGMKRNPRKMTMMIMNVLVGVDVVLRHHHVADLLRAVTTNKPAIVEEVGVLLVVDREVLSFRTQHNRQVPLPEVLRHSVNPSQIQRPSKRLPEKPSVESGIRPPNFRPIFTGKSKG